MSDYQNLGGRGSTDWLLGAVKKNPEGLLLFAAGCALLLRSGRSRPESDFHGNVRHDNRSRLQPGRGVSQATDAARQYASDLGETVSDTAATYVSAAAEYTENARRAVAEQSGRMADQAQSTVEQIVREQPLAVAIAGFAAGAAIAATFPATRIERETLGAYGKKASEAAAAAGQRLGNAASAAGERLKSAAEERGLNADGLKEVARDVAATVRKSISETDANPSGTGQTGAGTSVGGSTSSQGKSGQAGNATMGAGSRSDAKSGGTAKFPS